MNVSGVSAVLPGRFQMDIIESEAHSSKSKTRPAKNNA